MSALQMTNALNTFLMEKITVKQIEDNKFEITTPYQHSNDPTSGIILYASMDGDKIRLSDGGYLTEKFLRLQDTNSPFQIDMGVHRDGVEGEPRLEDGEFVADCTVATFGESVLAMVHGIIIIGTSKTTMLMMIQVFKAVMMGPPHDVNAAFSLGLPEGPKYEA